MEVTLQSFRKRFTYDPAKDLLGKGGFGEVYKAYDNEDHIHVALKISHAATDDKYNLISEIKRFKKLNHPNIIKHIEAYEVNTGSTDIHGNLILYHVGILEYANNGTLADLLKKGTPDYRLIEDLAKDIIEGLAYLHSQNIIHRDLKPTNILLFNEGEKLRAKITDFGIAKRIDATAASTQLVGTVEYMAPEFFSTGNITPASDMWSLGVMLLEALTGTHPFGKTTLRLSNEQIINNILNKDLNSATQNLTEPLKGVITRCLLREANLRPQSTNELKGLLQAGEDAFSERTQVISAKPQTFVIEKTSSEKIRWIIALLDFDLFAWKKEIGILSLFVIFSLIASQYRNFFLEYQIDKYKKVISKIEKIDNRFHESDNKHIDSIKGLISDLYEEVIPLYEEDYNFRTQQTTTRYPFVTRLLYPLLLILYPIRCLLGLLPGFLRKIRSNRIRNTERKYPHGMASIVFILLLLAAVFTFYLHGKYLERELQEEAHVNTQIQDTRVDVKLAQLTSNKDLVCGMLLEDGRISDTVSYKGRLYGFCATECKIEFKNDPQSFLLQD